MSVTVEDDWGRRDASENAGVVPESVYQPSVPDKRAYRRGIYTNADLSSAFQIFLSFSIPRSNVIVRRYNSNAKTPLTSMYSHSRYYFYTRDTASVARDKGKTRMTFRNNGTWQLLDEHCVRFNFVAMTVIFDSLLLPRFPFHPYPPYRPAFPFFSSFLVTFCFTSPCGFSKRKD